MKFGEKFGEVLVLDTQAYVNLDLDAKDKTLQRAELNKDGSIGALTACSLDEFEAAIAHAKMPPRVFIKESTFESLKKIFGRDVEILVSI